MPTDPVHPPRPPFFGLTPTELDTVIADLAWPSFRAAQVRDWVYKKTVASPELMSNLSKVDRQKLAERLEFAPATVTRNQLSEDGTRKLLLTWPDGSNAETVMIPDGDRRTACVSSQVGCPVRCTFCASGIEGVKGNLSPAQIVEQVWQLNDAMVQSPENKLRKPEDRDRVTNIVFMGMGEPLANYANVMKAIRILHDPQCFNIGGRRITVSTVGVPARMKQLAHEELPLNLAISLHAPSEPLRKQLIPWAEHFALNDILDAARYYFERTGREVTLEYILLAGVNDRPQHAKELSRIARSIRANVNLIRYNEVESLPFKRPISADVMEFQEVLRQQGVNAHVRKSRGRDIDAACGQLRRKEQQERQAGEGAALVRLGAK